MLLQQQQQPVTPTVVPVEEQKEEIELTTDAPIEEEENTEMTATTVSIGQKNMRGSTELVGGV